MTKSLLDIYRSSSGRDKFSSFIVYLFFCSMYMWEELLSIVNLIKCKIISRISYVENFLRNATISIQPDINALVPLIQ